MIFTKKFFVLILLLVVIGAGLFVYKQTDWFKAPVDTTTYYAVFLTNGQVYFGNMKSETKSQYVLTDVHYLQLEDSDGALQGQLNESRFTLIKMGNEIHGPTDELFINKQNVLFHEKLRDDSKVVDSIIQSRK